MQENTSSFDLPPLSDHQLVRIREHVAEQHNYSEPVVFYDMRQPFSPIVACNEAFARLYGYDQEAVTGSRLSQFRLIDDEELSEEDDLEYRRSDFFALRANGSSYADFRGQSRDGRRFFGEYSQRLVDLYGRELVLEIHHMVSFNGAPFNHQSESQPAAAEVPEIEEFQRFFRNVTHGVALIDPYSPRHTIVDCNDRYSRMLGYPREEIVGHPAADFGAHWTAQSGAERYETWLREQAPYYGEHVKRVGTVLFSGAIRRSDGSIYHIHYMGSIISLHGKEYLLVIIRNTTRHNLAEASQEVIRNLISMIMGDVPLSQLLDSVIYLLQRECSGVGVAALLYQKGQLLHASSPHLPPTFAAAIEAFKVKPAGTLLGKVLETRENTFIDDVAASFYSASPEVLAVPWARSCWMIPVLSRAKELLGLIVIYGHACARPTFNELELLETVRNLVAVAIEQREMTNRLEYQAGHDALTGLPNRVLFQDRLQQAVSLAERRSEQLAVMFLDLDGFKQVNDTLGHAAGDLLLQEVAHRLQGCIRASDTIARMGGDEFTLTLPNINHLDDAALVANKVLDVLRAPFHILEHEIFVSASIGITMYPRDATDIASLQRNADAAMYRAKASGKSRYEFFQEEISQRIQARFELKSQLRHALQRKEFELFYQPLIELVTGQVIGLEALIRWRHPKIGMMLPLSFIPAAEECGIILRIGDWVVNEACRQMAQWQREGLILPKMTVNISSLQFGQNEFFNALLQTLQHYDIEPHRIELELTESVLMQEVDEASRQMKRLKDMGIRIAIDDFGTGYSSLSYLQKLPADVLKIDRSFVQKIDCESSSRLLVEAIVTLARGLNLQVAAEGVETTGELKVLRELDCDFAQGFYLAAPMPAREVQQLLCTKQLQIF